MATKWKAGNYNNSGLSKSQYLAKQKKKPVTKPAPKTLAKTTAVKPPSQYQYPIGPGLGAQGESFVTQDKAGSFSGLSQKAQTKASPKAKEYREPAYSPAKNRAKAAMTFNDFNNAFKSAGLTLESVPSPRLSGQTQLEQRQQPGIAGKAKAFLNDIFGIIGNPEQRVKSAENYDNRGLAAITPEEREKNLMALRDTTLGMRAQASAIPDLPTGYGDNGEILYNDNTVPGVTMERYLDPNTGRLRIDPNAGIQYDSRIPVDQPLPLSAETRDPWNGPESDPSLDEEMGDLRKWKPETGRASDRDVTPPVVENPFPQDMQTGGGTIPRRFGSGAFGTGKGVMGGADDDYIKELRRSLRGDFGEKNARREFEELLKALDPTYSAQQQTATEEMERSKLEDIQKLASLFAANNTAGSEQQEQYVQRTQSDYATQLANLLAKLAASKNQDISQLRAQYQNRLSQIGESKASAQQRVADLIRQAEDRAFDREYKMAEFARKSQPRARAKTTSTPKKQIWVDPETGDIYEYQG